MKRLAYLNSIIVFVLSITLLIPQVALADDINVNSQSNGQSTVCHNGDCTTTGGGSKSTVCVNGQCTTTDDGNVDYSSPDGHDQVHIHNNSEDNSASVSPQVSVSPTETPSPTEIPEPSMTPDPTITQMRDDINKHVKEEIEGVKEHIKDHNAAISDFFKAEMDNLQNLLNTFFK